MHALSRTLTLVAISILAVSCEDPQTAPSVVPLPGKGTPAPANPSKTPARTQRPLPKFGPLTAEAAQGVLRSQLDDLAGDDLSRQALLYHVDLGDRAAVNKIHEKLLTKDKGLYDDLAAAAIGVEALLAFGEPGAPAMAIDVAKQYADEENGEDPDEYVAHMLGRVTGPEKAQAVSYLLKFAGNENEDAALGSVQELARLAAPEARGLFVTIAENADFLGVIRGAAVAGLLRLGDPKGKELADLLIQRATSEAGDPKAPEDVPDLSEVIQGLGVVNAVEAAPYVRKAVDACLPDEPMGGVWEVPEAANAMERIFRAGGGAEYVEWWRKVGLHDESSYEEEAALALFFLGDDASVAPVAESLQGTMATGWDMPNAMDGVQEILDTAARRGIAGKPPFRAIVDTAAQLDAKIDPARGINTGIRSLSLAAAHAFLKSGAK